MAEVDAAFERGDTQEAIALLERVAESGVAEAQYRLGFRLSLGDGVGMDPARALHWLERAADNGWRQAAIDLGNMYLSGVGVPRDEARALFWMNRSAELARAQNVEDDC